jgi:hypothetical protein
MDGRGKARFYGLVELLKEFLNDLTRGSDPGNGDRQMVDTFDLDYGL